MTSPYWISGGPILTMDPECPRASAVLVRDGIVDRVLPPGASVPPTESPVIDLGGECLLPGFIDAHTHLFHWGLLRIRPDLRGTASIEQAIEIVSERHRSLPPGEVLIAEAWDESFWSTRRYPTREELDHAFPDRPVIFRRVCGHMAVANTRALERIPAGPQVDAAIGLLVEDASMGLARVFPPSDRELEEALLAAQASYHSLGVTAVHDMTTPDQMKVLSRVDLRGDLKLTINAILTRPHLEVLSRSGIGAGWTRGKVTIWGVKFFSDGSLGARTAALLEGYADAPEERGLLLLSPAELEGAARDAEESGIPLAIHAIGDRAIETVVAAFEKVVPRGCRLGHRIEHLEMPGPGVLERMKRLGITASMQPNFVALWGHPGGMYEARLGGTRVARMNPFRKIVDTGVLLALGSDAMPAGVLEGLKGAVESPFPDQRLTPHEALLGTTSWAARSGGDVSGGRIVPGSRADFVVLNRDPTAVKSWGDLTLRATWAGGERVFHLPASDPANSSRGGG